MTGRAEAIRDRRRRFAAPGGSHDRLISRLNKLLPAAIGAVAAVMVLAPLSPRGAVSFLLDRRKVAITGDRIDVQSASYRGTDNEGRLFQVNAGRAQQSVPSVPVVAMQQLLAELELQDGPARVTAPTAAYNFNTDKLGSRQPLTFTGANGYRMTMSNVIIDLKTHQATGSGGVAGSLPAGSFTAEGLDADLIKHTVALTGRAHMRMTPGKMTVPK